MKAQAQSSTKGQNRAEKQPGSHPCSADMRKGGIRKAGREDRRETRDCLCLFLRKLMAQPRVASQEEEEFWIEGKHRKNQITLLTHPSPPICPLETPRGSKVQTGLFLEQEKEKTQG